MKHRLFPGQFGFPSTESVEEETFKEFEATELFCPQCNRAVPVRKHLLLVLPEGEKYEYLCEFCSTSVGIKINRGVSDQGLIII